MNTMLKLAAVLAAAGALGNAHAVVLSPGMGPIAGPTVGSPYPSISDFGTLLKYVSTDVSTAGFAGEVRAAVFDGKEAGVNLDFYYQFSNYSDSVDSIARLTAGGFGGMSVDVRQDGGMWGEFVRGMSSAGTVDMSSDGTLGFNFTPTPLNPGMTTTVLRVRTAATAFIDNWMAFNGTIAPAFAPGGGVLPPPVIVIPPPVVEVPLPGVDTPPPVAEIPEPETYALMLAGLGMLGVASRRRRHD